LLGASPVGSGRRAGAACRSGGAEGTSLSARNLEGAEDSDVIYGGGGNDIIDAATQDLPSSEFPTTEPVDHSYGGGGNDRINAVDGNEDIINCGRGKGDVAFIDDIDTVIRDCKRKIAVE
jgi:Ca2+-binding RTX toxin-like protein